MNDKMIVHGILLDDATTVSFVEICHKYQINEDLLIEIVEHGIIDVDVSNIRSVQFDLCMQDKILTVCRLQRDLGINVAGVALVLDLLDELENSQKELSILQRYFTTYSSSC